MSYEQRLHLAQAELDGLASDEDLALLAGDTAGWVEALEGLLRVAERRFAEVRASTHGPERRLVLEDFGGERDRVAARLEALRGSDEDEPDDEVEEEEQPRERTGTAKLQLSWGEDRLIAWSGGQDADAEDLDTVRHRLESIGAPAAGWEEHEPVPLPDTSPSEPLL